MQIDELAGNTVKITLDPSDMDGYRIKCEDISGDSRTSELALSRLISCLSEDHNLGLCGERLLVEAFPKATEVVPYISPALKALRPEKTLPADRRLRRSSARESFAFSQGFARHSRLSQTVYPYTQIVTGKITVLPFICRRANLPKAASALYGTSCRSTASRYIRISAV